MKKETLCPLLEGKTMARVHAHRADDMVMAVEIAKEFGYRVVVDHSDEAHLILDYLKENHVSCTFGPVFLQPVKYEMEKMQPETAGLLEQAGVPFALTTDGFWDVQYTPSFVGSCIPYGLSYECGRRAVTIAAAQLLNIDNRVGSLEAGKDAYIAIFTGDPIVNTSRCVATMIEGEFVWREGE